VVTLFKSIEGKAGQLAKQLEPSIVVALGRITSVNFEQPLNAPYPNSIQDDKLEKSIFCKL